MARHAEGRGPSVSRRLLPIAADAARSSATSRYAIAARSAVRWRIADPSADYPVAMLALEARMVLSKAGGGRRVVGADKFFVGPLTSVLTADELLTEIQLPKRPRARAAPTSSTAWWPATSPWSRWACS